MSNAQPVSAPLVTYSFDATLKAIQICVQAHVAVFLWGTPGHGKSASTNALTKQLDIRQWTIILATREPTDQSGLPLIVDKGVKIHPPLWAQELVDANGGCVFWDEFNGAEPGVQNSALRVLNEGWAGDLKLPDATSHVGAGNPPRLCSGAFDLTAAAANRYVHIDFKLGVDTFVNGMISGWAPPPMVRLPKDWHLGFSAKRGLVASFIRRRPMLMDQLPTNSREQGRAYPSPRSWERSALLLAAASSCGFETKSEVARILLAGCVGEAAATEFFSWLNDLDLRDPEEYLREPKTTPLPTRQDQIMATLDSVAAAAVDGHTSKDKKVRDRFIRRYRAAWSVTARLFKTQPDITLPAVQTLANAMPHEIERDLPDEMADILPMLQKAGINFKKR